MQPAAASRYVAPRDAIELRLVQIWEALLNVRPIGVTDRFFEVGGHSLLALRLLVDVEHALGRKVPLPALFEEPTIEHLAAVLRQKDARWQLMVTLRAGDQPLKLFLIHPGGGTLLNYVHLVRHLPPDIPVHGIQARGLDGASEPHDSVEQMAADYVDEIRRLQPGGPYLLAGHSFGGVIAFEMARQLQRQGEPVAFLGLFDSVAPLSAHDHDAPDDGRRDDARRLTAMAEAIGRFLGKSVDVSYDALSALTADEQIDAVVDALTRARALPPGDEQNLVRNLLNVSKAHSRGHRAYKPEAVAVPITLFRVEHAREADYPSADPALLRQDSLGWDALTTARLQIVTTAGNHVTMLSAAHSEDWRIFCGPVCMKPWRHRPMSDTATIPRVHRPDVAEFRRRFERPLQPVVLTGVMDGWKAMRRWSPEYFAEHMGDAPVPVMTCDEDLSEDEPIRPEQLMRLKRVPVKMHDYVRQMASGSVLRGYVSGIPLKPHLPMLIDDIEFPEYREIGSPDSPRIWLGTRVNGPLHYDPSSNLHGIVYGGKRFTLFHPNQLPLLYPCSMLSTIPQMSQASLSNPDYARFPRLRKAKPVTLDLGPGDLLFLPAGWWHQVTTPTPTISIDFPWQKTPQLGRPFMRLVARRMLRTCRGRLGYS